MAWEAHPSYPFADGFADRVSMMCAPLTDKNVTEMARVLAPHGSIDLWVDPVFAANADMLAALVKGVVMHPGQDDALSCQIQACYKHVRILAHTSFHDEA
jgi:hypothetical protein